MAEPKPVTVEPGDVLIGPPSQLEDIFHRTVVLLCVHDEEGSLGLVLNFPMDLTLDRLMDKELHPHLVYYGGPVARNSITYLHRCGDHIQNSLPVAPNVFFCGEFEDVVRMVKRDHSLTAKQIRFFAGYSGWAPGQLNAELEREYWIVTRGQARMIFEQEPLTLWQTVLQEMGGKYAIIAGYPHDLRMN
ncbi:MAG: YqgE/AlgH family protein [Bacteroidetes bacterium]|nr:YqgE/AlgH family protein [Bacteroidota bacterium]MCY4205612.1 YqgE/AlgH family protein [Bacteroidota bacterium]